MRGPGRARSSAGLGGSLGRAWAVRTPLWPPPVEALGEKLRLPEEAAGLSPGWEPPAFLLFFSIGLWVELQRCLTGGGVDYKGLKWGRGWSSLVLSALRAALLVSSGRLEPTVVISQVWESSVL